MDRAGVWHGAGLSSRMGAVLRPRLGSILAGKGLVSGGQIEAGLAEARQTGSRIGKALVSYWPHSWDAVPGTDGTSMFPNGVWTSK